MMNAAVTDGTGKVWIEKIPIPQPGPGQCLCRMLAAATCSGTDRKIAHGKLQYVTSKDYPGVLGHESVGEVIECGPGVTAFQKGDLVIRPTAVYPDEHYAGFGSCWGAFAEYGLITDTRAFLAANPGAGVNSYCRYQLKIPAGLISDPADAVMLITLKEVLGFAHSVGIGYLTPVLLLGCGSVGRFFCQAVKLLGGYPLIVAARNGKQRQAALKAGADFAVDMGREGWTSEVLELTGGRGAARIVDTTGVAAPVLASFPALAPDGRVTLYATYAPEEQAKLPKDKLLRGETGEVEAHPFVCSLLRHGALNVRRQYSHRLPFRMVAEGLDMIDRKEAFKVVFDF